jgi:hypothetical protein
MLTRVLHWMPLPLLVLAACEPHPRDASEYNSSSNDGECPANSQWDGLRCVRTDVVCPDGSSFEGGKCVAYGASSTTAPDSLAGAYSVEGTRADGVPYNGFASVTELAKGGPYRVSWTVNGKNYDGLGTKRGDVLSVGWSTDPDHGVADYVAKGDGALDGVWYDTSSLAPGRELLTGGLNNLAGQYSIAKAATPKGAPYNGTCDVAVLGELHYVMWHVGKDTYRGLGIRDGDVLSVGFSTAKSANFGVIQYRIAEGKLTGRWAEYAQKLPGLGNETMTKK